MEIHEYYMMLDMQVLDRFQTGVRDFQPILQEAVEAFKACYLEHTSEPMPDFRIAWDEERDRQCIVTHIPVPNWTRVQLIGGAAYCPAPDSGLEKHMPLEDYYNILNATPTIHRNVIDRPDFLGYFNLRSPSENGISVAVLKDSQLLILTSVYHLKDPRFIPEANLGFLKGSH